MVLMLMAWAQFFRTSDFDRNPQTIPAKVYERDGAYWYDPSALGGIPEEEHHPWFNLSNPLTILLTSGRFIFAYMCHTNVVTIATVLKNKDDKTALKLSVINVIAIMVFYILIGAASYLTFGQGLSSLYISNYDEEDVISNILRVLLILMMVGFICSKFLQF